MYYILVMTYFDTDKEEFESHIRSFTDGTTEEDIYNWAVRYKKENPSVSLSLIWGKYIGLPKAPSITERIKKFFTT